MRQELFQQILMARQRVYEIGAPTPLEALSAPIDAEVYIKREDLSPIHAYKWRGAYNRMATLSPDEYAGGVVAASAGNHAQGVAVAARHLGLEARIYMPASAPMMKQAAVALHGGEQVEIILHGDDYDAAAAMARDDVAESGAVFVHPFDDLETMGGQGTLADEVVMSGQGPFDAAYLQIGGGGMAASVACWLKAYYPDIRIVGVEGLGQASMQAAMKAGKPVTLDHVDVFCDGTAVKRAGDRTFALCSELLDDFITVSNEEVCAAIQVLWETRRCIAEPAGAMGLAGMLKDHERVKGQRVLCVLCGSNLDFGQLAWIGGHAAIGASRRRYFRFEIGEAPGTMLKLLESAMDGVSIIDFQYGKVHERRAWPVIGFEASPMDLELLGTRLRDLGISHEDVTSQEDVEFRIIHYEPHLFRNPYFFKLEFPERPGALHDFLAIFRGSANLCYFNYSFTGEQVGRAMMGFEFEDEDGRNAFKKTLSESKHEHQEIAETVLERIL
jgi:threonine dehydratase